MLPNPYFGLGGVLGHIGKQQIPPLRFAAVGMTT
jgi:hypothetical protein